MQATITSWGGTVISDVIVNFDASGGRKQGYPGFAGNAEFEIRRSSHALIPDFDWNED